MATLARCGLLLALLAATAAAYDDLYQCPRLGINNCTASDGLAFFDGCKVIACVGWQSAVTNPRYCRPAAGTAELARCSRLEERLARMKKGSASGGSLDAPVNCPQFSGLDLCASADEFFSYHDGCNYHLCDGSGGAIDRTWDRCPDAVTPAQLFFCASNYNSVVRTHTSRHACSVQVNNADRICEVMWPGYRFGDICFGGNDFVCGPGGRILTRPPSRLCPLLDAAQSVKCREVAREVADLLSESTGFTCPELQYPAVCTYENRGFVYNDGCNLVMCHGEESGLTEGRVCKLPFTDNPAGRVFCARQAAIIRSRVGASLRHTAPCMTAIDACVGATSEGESYFDGCNYCTCLGHGQSQCTRHECAHFYGTVDEFAVYCRRAAYRLP